MSQSGDAPNPPITNEEADEVAQTIQSIRQELGVNDDVLAALLAGQVALGRVQDRQDAFLSQLNELHNELVEQETTKTAFPFEFSTNVPAGTGVDSPTVTERTIPDAGRIVELIVGWPDGADNAVGVQFRTKSGERYFPRNDEDEYIAANDFTHPFPIKAPVGDDDTLAAEFVNGDSTNSHFVNVIAMVEFENDEGDQGGAE